MPHFWDGLLVTLQALALGSLISFALGLVWALLHARRRRRWVRWPVGVVTEFIRNTPLLVQLFFLFYVLPEWGITALRADHRRHRDRAALLDVHDAGLPRRHRGRAAGPVGGGHRAEPAAARAPGRR